MKDKVLSLAGIDGAAGIVVERVENKRYVVVREFAANNKGAAAAWACAIEDACGAGATFRFRVVDSDGETIGSHRAVVAAEENHDELREMRQYVMRQNTALLGLLAEMVKAHTPKTDTQPAQPVESDFSSAVKLVTALVQSKESFFGQAPEPQALPDPEYKK